MPKILDYPRAPLARALEIATAVDALGGECTTEMCANQMDRKVGGAFAALVGASTKFGFVENNRQKLTVTQLFRDYKLSYSEEESRNVLLKAFVGVPVFRDLAERFDGKRVPIQILPKLLIKEFGVSNVEASRVAGYFLEAAKDTGILVDDGHIKLKRLTESSVSIESRNEEKLDERTNTGKQLTTLPIADTTDYIVSIRGPGMNSEIAIKDADDLLVVDAILRKVKNALIGRANIEQSEG